MNKILTAIFLLLCISNAYASSIVYEVCVYSKEISWTLHECFDSINIPEIQGNFLKFITPENKTIIVSGVIVARKK